MGIGTRFRNGITLTADSLALLRHHPTLLVFPLIAGITAAVFLGIFLGTTFGFLTLTPEGPMLIILFFVYLGLTFISTFFTAALVHETRVAVLDGTPSLRNGIAEAWGVKRQLFLWALISATVGIIINAIENSDSTAARVLGSIFGVAWTLMTFFVVPVIVFEREGTYGMFSRSISTFKDTWGETPISLIGVQVISAVVGLLFLVCAYALWFTFPVAAIAIGLVGVAVSFLLAQTLKGIIKTTLYLYATEGVMPSEFDNVDFDDLAEPSQRSSSDVFGAGEFR